MSNSQEFQIQPNTRFKSLHVAASGELLLALDDYIARSIDGGETWQLTQKVTHSKNSNFIARREDVLLMPSNDGKVVWRSTDKGATWKIFGEFTDTFIQNSGDGKRAFDSDGTVYFCPAKRLYFTENAGITWREALPLRSQSGLESCGTITSALDAIYVRGQDSFYKSVNKGVTWESIYIKDPYPDFRVIDIQDFKISRQGILYFLNKGTVYKSVDTGRRWEIERIVPTPGPISTIDLIAGEVFLIGIVQAAPEIKGNPSVFYYRVVDGEIKNRFDGAHLNFIQLDNNGNYYALSRISGPVKSVDHGETWKPLFKPNQQFKTRHYKSQ